MRRPVLIQMLVVFVCLVVARVALGEANDSKLRAKYGRLIAQLISTVDNPIEELNRKERKNTKLDTPAQMIVKRAYDELAENISSALPEVTKHVNDDRFSYVYRHPHDGQVYDMSVGSACRKLVHESVEVYQRVFPLEDERRPPSFIDEVGGIAEWWETRQDKNLKELQLEASEWAVSKAKELERSVKGLTKQQIEIEASKNGIMCSPLQLDSK